MIFIVSFYVKLVFLLQKEAFLALKRRFYLLFLFNFYIILKHDCNLG